MTMRTTPFTRIRYPWTSDVVSAADVQSMASDIDQQLVTTAKLANDFSKFASVRVVRTAAQSIPKTTLTTINFDSTPSIDNGSDSPLANANWFNPSLSTRLTAPVNCLVLAHGFAGLNLTSALGSSGCIQVTVGLNGTTAWQQGTKFSPISTVTGQQWGSALTAWQLVAGDYLELKVFWNGTPAGPLSTDNVIPASLSLMMVALQNVA